MTTYTQTTAVPLSIAVFLAVDHYDHNDDPYTISTTTIIKPIRQIILGRRAKSSDEQVELASMMASRIGTAIHSGIELAWSNKEYRDRALKSLNYPQRVIDRVRVNPTEQELRDNPDIIPVYMEQRWERKIGRWTVTGKVDFVGEGQLEDFKTASSYVVTTGVNDAKFGLQGSVYRWLKPEIITQPDVKIQFIITDWSSMMAKQDPTYPQSRHVQRVIPLKPVQEIHSMLTHKIDMLETYMDADESSLPECTAEELQRSESKYKYYKDGNTSAPRSTKNFDNYEEAHVFMQTKGGQGAIKHVPGQVTACRFCDGFMLCSQKDRLVASGDLTL